MAVGVRTGSFTHSLVIEVRRSQQSVFGFLESHGLQLLRANITIGKKSEHQSLKQRGTIQVLLLLAVD